MRLYNPEWEAIKEYEHAARYKDVQFELSAGAIPADHGYSLYQALVAILPWLAEDEGAGIHPVHGAPSGRDDNLIVNRRVKLMLRVPVARLADIQALVGRRIDCGAGALTLGAAKEKPLMPFAYLYAPLVDFGTGDEIAFLDAARAELEKMTVKCGLIPGKQRKMHTPGGEIRGYSLMLHDVSHAHSLRVQEAGLGLHRGYGCGLFVPHKSIKEVAID